MRWKLGEATTNTQGIAVYEYTGTGAGELLIKAKARNLLSERYSLIDALFYDKAVTGHKNENTYYNAYCQETVSDTGTTVAYTGSTYYLQYRFGQTNSTDKPFSIGTKIEFEVVDITTMAIVLYGNSNYNRSLPTSIGKITIIVDDDYITLYQGDTKITEAQTSNYITSNFGFGFTTNSATAMCKYKEMKIYPIESEEPTPVEPVVTTVTLNASASSITYGSSVVFTAIVKDQNGSVMSGQSVTFKEGSTTLGSGTTDGSGVVTLSKSDLTVGSHTITAVCGSVNSSSVTVSVSSASVVTSLTVSADKSVLSYYDSESATLSALVKDQNGSVMSGQTVVFKKGSSTLATKTTNSSGVATYDYSANGSGDVTFTVECSNLQETYPIEDCYYANTGTTSTLTIDTGVSCTIEDGAIKITKSTSGEKFVTCNYDYYNTNQEISFKVPKINSSTNVPVGFAVYRSDGSQIYWAGYSKSGGKFDSKAGSETTTLSAGDTIRIVKSGSTLTAYKGETIISSVSTATSGIRLAFYTNNTYIQYIDDIKIKPL